MSSTNKTTYYELPQFVDSDLFNPLVDDNDAYSKIDTALHQIAEAEAGDASEIVGVKSRVTTAEGKIEALETQNGVEVLTTTAQTLSGAVNELDGDASSLDGRLDVVEDDINNVNTGLKVKVSALETQNGSEVLTTTSQTLSGAVNELDGDVADIKAQNGNEVLTTTAQTLSGAVNELKNDMDIFFGGNYNITTFNNTENLPTKVYWRHISSDYSPKVAHSVDVDYAVKMSNENGATVAINGGAFTPQNDFRGYYRENHVTYNDNDMVYTDRDILTFKNNQLNSVAGDTSTATLDEADYEWALQGFKTFIENGTVKPFAMPDYVDNDYAPRSFIAQCVNGDYIIACTDGRSSSTTGFNYPDMAKFLLSLGYSISFAYNLDGGGSVTLSEKGVRVNDFINNDNRKVKDIIYFKKDSGYYNDLLKAKTAEINTDFESRTNYANDFEGNFASYESSLYNSSTDTTGTASVNMYDLETRKMEAGIRWEKDRMFIPMANHFSRYGSAYNLLDLQNDESGETFNFVDIARSLLKCQYSSIDIQDQWIDDSKPTGIYHIYVSSASAATAMGLQATDTYRVALFRIKLNKNYDLVLTPAHVYYRYDNGTLITLN